MSTNYKIHLFTEQKNIDCSSEQSILDATQNAGINHTSICQGMGQCSTCRVNITSGLENCSPRTEAEKVVAERLDFPDNVRLACQTNISGDIGIRRIVAHKDDIQMLFDRFSRDDGNQIGRQQKLAILFTDIVEYTKFSENLPPYDIVHILNRYYHVMNTIIEKHHGIISDIAGDGILAAFGIHEVSDNTTLNAVRTVLEMQKELVEFNKYLKQNFNTTINIRAGIDFGDVVVSSINTGAMRKIAIIGDHVNFASRIEAANKNFSTNLLLSEDAYAEVSDQFPQHTVNSTKIKGKTGIYKLYELL